MTLCIKIKQLLGVIFILLTPLWAGISSAKEAQSPTEVNIKYIINSIYDIDTLNQTFKADFYLYMDWQSPSGKLCSAKTDWGSTWKPAIEFVNSLNELTARKEGYECLNLDKKGKAKQFGYWGRYQGTFQAHMNFEQFPFDMQQLTISVESYEHDSSKMRFTYHDKQVGGSPLSLCNSELDCVDKKVLIERPPLSEWQMTNISTQHTLTDYSATEGDGVTYAQLSLNIELKRLYQHYLWKILLPTALLILFSLLIFIPSPEDFMNRFRAALTLFLSIVALSLVTKEILPPAPYIVLADAFMLGAYIMIFGAAIESAAVYLLNSKIHKYQWLKLVKLPSRIDRVCFVVFPLLYIAFCLHMYKNIGY